MKNFFYASVRAAALAAVVFALSSVRADEKLTDEQIVKDVKLPEGFDMTIFAKPPMANYPVFVAAAPDGTLYVSSDGNGSLGRDPNRGRILRLRDLNGDGKADEVKEFVKNVDSPRGLVWDHDRLYVMHPPHLSVYIDADKDGVAEKEVVLVKDCAFGFKDRPADHTTNGIELGPDGWIYVAQGDFGFMEATGTDGRKLQFRGGGVWRVRTDGTGMEMYTFGTRNIVGAAVSPTLELFARDNTNDGGGWDLRYHHLSGLEDHGYPKLYMNFSDEIVKWLADYGGGSGCGDGYVDEPGFVTGHYSADWGRGWIYRHENTPKGATFETKPHEFLKMTRPTDVDADGMGHLFAASWRGAQFKWDGPDVGYIVRVSPKGAKSEPLPNFEKMTDVELIKQFLSPSMQRRMAAQRMLLRRGLSPQFAKILAALANDSSKPIASRVLAVFTIKQGLGANAVDELKLLTAEPTIRAWAIRALTDHEGQLANVPSAPIVLGLKDADSRTRLEATIAAARLGKVENAAAVLPLLEDADALIAHTAGKALVRLKAAQDCFGIVDSSTASPVARTGALRVLQALHQTDVVDGLILRLGKEQNLERRKGIIVALARLAMTEGVWTGSSWGTRPDTRGPYYQPEKWAETEKIEKTLQEHMAKAKDDELGFMLTEFSRHRINPGDAGAKVVELALKNDALIPTAVNQLVNSGNTPASALPFLAKAARSETLPDEVVSKAVIALAKLESLEAFTAMLDGVDQLEGGKKRKASKHSEKARNAFLDAAKLDQHVELYETTAAKMDGAKALWSDAALLKIASKKVGSPEPPAHAREILDKGWAEPKRRAQIITAAQQSKNRFYDSKIVAALADTDKAVAKAAKDAVAALKIDADKVKAAAASTSPKIGTMKVEDVIAAVLKTKGDASRGPQLFMQATCFACHTTKKDEPVKGPFLGNIATIYPRRDLAEAILVPGKTIAQGFVTYSITLKDGTIKQGFVVQEAADAITIRDIAAQETKIPVANIAKREKLETSLMPPGLTAGLTVDDLASLLTWFEQLAKQN